MPAITLLNVSILAVVYIAYHVLSTLYRSHRFARFAAKNGAVNAPDYTKPFPMSLIDPVLRLRHLFTTIAAGGDIMDDIMVPEFAEYTTLQRPGLAGHPIIGTIEPANLQAMIATQFEDFEVGQARYNQMSPLLGKSIFTTDGSFWQHSRASLRPQFNRENINNLDTTNAASLELIEAIGSVDADNWTEVTDLLPLIYNFTLDTATEFLFGESVGSQAMSMQKRKGNQQNYLASHKSLSTAADQASSEHFMTDFALVSEKLINRIQFQGLYFLGDSLAFRRSISNLKRFTSTFVSRAISQALTSYSQQQHQKSPPPSDKPYSLLSSLATQVQDPTELRNQSLAILTAGRDTTASLLAWSLVRLSLHPEVYSRLRKAVLDEFGDGKEDKDAAEKLNFAKLKSCRALQHFMNEVLRLHPPVPINNRIAARDTTLPVGAGEDRMGKVAVRKGQTVMFSVYVLHRRKDLWGEDALEFKPERWEKRYPAWQFLPFHGGPRICLGQQYALTEAGFLLVRILQEFDVIEPVDRAQMSKFKKGLGLAMWPCEGVRVRLHKA